MLFVISNNGLSIDIIQKMKYHQPLVQHRKIPFLRRNPRTAGEISLQLFKAQLKYLNVMEV